MTPTKTKGQDGENVKAPQDNTTNTHDSASLTDKRKAYLYAEFCRAGFAVHELADGGYLVARTARVCPSLHALVSYGRQLGLVA